MWARCPFIVCCAAQVFVNVHGSVTLRAPGVSTVLSGTSVTTGVSPPAAFSYANLRLAPCARFQVSFGRLYNHRLCVCTV